MYRDPDDLVDLVPAPKFCVRRLKVAGTPRAFPPSDLASGVLPTFAPGDLVSPGRETPPRLPPTDSPLLISRLLHNLDLLFRQTVEAINSLIYLLFQRGCVDVGIVLFGGKDLLYELHDLVMFG